MSVASASNDGTDVAGPNKEAYIYPNPVRDKMILAGVPGSGRGAIHLMDAQGRLAWKTQAFFNTGEPTEITCRGLSPGLYMGRVFLDGEVYGFKLLKMN